MGLWQAAGRVNPTECSASLLELQAMVGESYFSHRSQDLAYLAGAPLHRDHPTLYSNSEMMPDIEDALWIVVVAYILAFFLAFGVGANDVANSFGTSVGSKVLTLRQACIIATIFETLGAMMLGSKVSDTVRKGILDISIYNSSAKELMLGNMAALGEGICDSVIKGAGTDPLLYIKLDLLALALALCDVGSAIWNILATFLKMPISGTHSIIGAIIGFSLVAKGTKGIQWDGLGKIVASWFVSPILSGIISILFYLFISFFVLKKEKPLEPGLKVLPLFYGFTIFVNIFSIVHDGPHFLKFDVIPWWGVLILSLGLCLLVAATVQFFVVPRIRNKAGQEILDYEKNYKEPSEVESNKRKEVSETTPINQRNNPSVPSIDPILDARTALSPEVKEKMCKDDITNDKSHEVAHSIEQLKKQDSPEVCQLFSPLQVLTATFGSFVHGGNDVSNCVGPLIAIWLIYKDGSVVEKSQTPVYLLFYGGVGISIGLWIWGKRVIKTMGTDLTTITPSSGFTIEIGAAFTVLFASKIGLPISTTHCKVGSVVMVGRVRSNNSVDWSLFRNIFLAWLVTVPVSAGISAAIMAILKFALIT
ncbi:Sodium-dependent phosphate transporter 1-A [Nymphon striatum]|nr:Sodium-dependent phosphate transporter 1-A [Nymphon striatum]